MLIAHDPGHGKTDTDTGVVEGGIVERDWVLSFAHDCVGALPWIDHRILRHSPVGMSYQGRAFEAAQKGAGLVVCHHVNAIYDSKEIDTDEIDEETGAPVRKTIHTPNPRVDGSMAFAIQGDHIGREVGDAVLRAAPSELRRKKPRATTAAPGDWTSRAYSVLRKYREHGLSAVLIEWGFATSPIDAAILKSPGSRYALIAAMGVGIARAYEIENP